MNIRALQAFRLVVSEGSVAGAARAMHISQPAVSRLVALLEAEFRLTLFRRSRQRLVLTDEGRAFLREASRILANLDELPRIAGEIRASRGQRLRLVTMPRISLSVVSPAVARFAAQYPDHHVSVDLRTRRDLELWIAGREYDLGIGNVPVHRDTVQGIPLVRSRLGVLLPAGHRLAGRKKLRLEDIAGERLIGQMPGLLLRRQVDELFGAIGLVPDYALETSSSQISCQMVACGAGLTVIDRLSISGALADSTRLVPLEPAHWVAFGIILPSGAGLDGLTAQFVDCLKAELATRHEKGWVAPARGDDDYDLT